MPQQLVLPCPVLDGGAFHYLSDLHLYHTQVILPLLEVPQKQLIGLAELSEGNRGLIMTGAAESLKP